MLSFTYGFLIQAEHAFYDLIFGSEPPGFLITRPWCREMNFFWWRAFP